MLTKIYLEGPMGDQFGREWELDVESPNDAIRLIDANRPGLLSWIRKNVELYSHYRVILENDSESSELSDETYLKSGGAKTIRFVPIVSGSGKWTNAIVGAATIVIGFVAGNEFLIKIGASMLLSGVIGALTMRTSNRRLASESAEPTSLESDVFDGPVNTSQQGVPIPLIYGRMLVGSHVISAGVIVDQLV